MPKIDHEALLKRLLSDAPRGPLSGELLTRDGFSDAESLKQAYATYARPTDLKPGDIVKWKPGMKNKRRPAEDEMAVVVEVYPAPVYRQFAKFAGSPIYDEPITARIAVLDSDGEFMPYGFDLSRFERAEN
jgi:hypothetical protein